jgi:hypothetical protein
MKTGAASSKPISRSRSVGYDYEGDFNETAMERVLERAQRTGVVTEYDTGRGHIVWFNGRPGKFLREVRTQVLAVLSAGEG